MSFIRVLVLSTLGFVIPIAISLFLLVMRGRAAETPAAQLPASVLAVAPVPADINSTSDDSDDSDEVVESSTGFAVYSKDHSLGPADGETFVVSFLVRFDKLPGAGRKNNLVSKYDRHKAPYAGWAIALRRLSTSVRPAVYLRGADGSGGWFTFSDYQFRSGEWYQLAVVIRRLDSVSVFIQPMNVPRNQLLKNGWITIGEGLSVQGDVEFLGGHSIADVAIPESSLEMVLGADRATRENFQGEVAEFLVASGAELPVDVIKLPAFLSGGPREIKQRIGSGNVLLWIADQGVDESSYARTVQQISPSTAAS